MVQFNNLWLLVGAVIPSFYTAQAPSVPDTYLNRFAASTIWSVAVVFASSLTLHQDLLKQPVPWVRTVAGGDIHLLPYILILATVTLVFGDMLFRLIARHSTSRVGVAITVALLIAIVFVAGHVCLIDNQFRLASPSSVNPIAG